MSQTPPRLFDPAIRRAKRARARAAGDVSAHFLVEAIADGMCHAIPAVPVGEIVDPTGCGDAFRAGLLYGIAQGWDWPTTGRLASLLGAIKIGQRGGQNHAFTRAGLAQQYRQAFAGDLPTFA